MLVSPENTDLPSWVPTGEFITPHEGLFIPGARTRIESNGSPYSGKTTVTRQIVIPTLRRPDPQSQILYRSSPISSVDFLIVGDYFSKQLVDHYGLGREVDVADLATLVKAEFLFGGIRRVLGITNTTEVQGEFNKRYVTRTQEIMERMLETRHNVYSLVTRKQDRSLDLLILELRQIAIAQSHNLQERLFLFLVHSGFKKDDFRYTAEEQFSLYVLMSYFFTPEELDQLITLEKNLRESEQILEWPMNIYPLLFQIHREELTNFLRATYHLPHSPKVVVQDESLINLLLFARTHAILGHISENSPIRLDTDFYFDFYRVFAQGVDKDRGGLCQTGVILTLTPPQVTLHRAGTRRGPIINETFLTGLWGQSLLLIEEILDRRKELPMMFTVLSGNTTLKKFERQLRITLRNMTRYSYGKELV